MDQPFELLLERRPSKILGLLVIGLSVANRGGVTEGASKRENVNASRDLRLVG